MSGLNKNAVLAFIAERGWDCVVDNRLALRKRTGAPEGDIEPDERKLCVGSSLVLHITSPPTAGLCLNGLNDLSLGCHRDGHQNPGRCLGRDSVGPR